MDAFVEDELGPRNLIMADVVLAEERVEVEVGDDLGESIVLLNILGDVGLVGVGIDLVVAVVLLSEVDHLQQDVELLLILHPGAFC